VGNAAVAVGPATGYNQGVSLLLVIACRTAVAPAPPPASLDPLARARRVSLAVRGLPLTEDELDRVAADPDVLPTLVDEWLETDAFGATVRDLHQEVFWTRVDTDFELPPLGPFTGGETAAINRSIGEGPLAVIEEVVRTDLPYDDLLAIDWTMIDSVLAIAYGLPYDPSGPTWQRATWGDDRPAAGLLADTGMWLRFRSSDTNYQRERANAITRIFLCEDFASADLPVLADGGVFTEGGTGPLAEPACASCHAQIDPIGSFLWGFRRYILPMEVELAYAAGCEGEHAPNCYPLQLWEPSAVTTWSELGMPEPALFGERGGDLADLGRLVAAHPAYPACVAKNFAGWLTQTEPASIPADRITAWTRAFEDSGRSAKALVAAIVLDPAFGTLVPEAGGWAPGVQHTRPEQWARTVEALTGFRFLARPTAASCTNGTQACWGEVDLLTTDRYGFRMMMGGISGYQVTAPTHGPTPTRTLALERAAFEAAGTVVAADLAAAPDDRRLLGPGAGSVDEPAVVAELVRLHRVVLGVETSPIDAEILAALELFYATLATGTPADAWTAVVAGLLLHPALVAY
jgi:hypothetical protein